ncbi:MAG: class I SAM-dependent methyltransferase [Chloroflexi bacterium]|nr:class I SAM-dependent methyltransferase [Chloroflexota bacterium]
MTNIEKNTHHAALNAKKWDARAETYDQKRFDYFRYMQKRLIALVPLKPGICLLDIGCGTGWAVRYVARSLDEQGEFYGIDLAPKMIERARENSRDYDRVHFMSANVESMSFADDFFDVAICTNSFHHYPNPQTALYQIRRILKPGGRLYIMDVTTDGPLSRLLDRVTAAREPEHVKFYSTAEYRSFFESARLKHVASQTILPPMKVHMAEKSA